MRYPLEPLATAAHITIDAPRHTWDTGTTGQPLVGMPLLAARIGVSERTIQRARRHGLTDRQADQWAIALGRLPHEIWGDLWWANVPADPDPELDRIRARHTHRTRLRQARRAAAHQPLQAAA